MTPRLKFLLPAALAAAFAAVLASQVAAATAHARPHAGERAQRVFFASVPKAAIQGKPARVVVRTGAGRAFCRLSVRYSDGASEYIGAAFSLRGRASFTWAVNDVAAPGKARLTVACGRAGTASRSVTVVGTLIPPKIDVAAQGFSLRPKRTGTSASFGVMLRNVSPNADALQVYVIVNFVMANGHLLGTRAESIDWIPAGKTYAHGGSLEFPAGAPIVRLEVVVKVGGRQRRVIHTPATANVRVVPDLRDATWVGAVQGELINDHTNFNLQRTKLSAVVFDASGNVLGGATGIATATLPPGTRQVFSLKNDVDAIPWARATRAAVSPIGTFVP